MRRGASALFHRQPSLIIPLQSHHIPFPHQQQQQTNKQKGLTVGAEQHFFKPLGTLELYPELVVAPNKLPQGS